MPKRTRSYRESLIEALRDPTQAAEYLNAALDDSEEMALVALRDIAEARQMAWVAEEAGVAREALYRMLRERGNPTYHSLLSILNALGLRVVFAPVSPIDDGQTHPAERLWAARAEMAQKREPRARRGAAKRRPRSRVQE